jgi:hypothetical protein
MSERVWRIPEAVDLHGVESAVIRNGLGEIVRVERIEVQDAAPAVDPIINPECRDGKHGNCHLDAWDNVKDEPAECECACHSGGAS